MEGGKQGTGAESEGWVHKQDYRVHLEPEVWCQFLEGTLERLVGARVQNSQILRERDPLKVFVHERT